MEKQREQTDEKTSEILNTQPPPPDIDQLCNLIDESTFGRLQQGSCSNNKSLSSRFGSVPACQVKAFRSSRLKRLNFSSKSETCTSSDDNSSQCRSLVSYRHRPTISMRFSLSSPSLLNRFRSLSTASLQSRRASHLAGGIRSSHNIRYSAPATTTTITLFRTQSILPPIVEEESNVNSTNQSQLSCTIVDTRRTTATSCNVEELAAYFDNFLYLPKSLSGAAELMYT